MLSHYLSVLPGCMGDNLRELDFFFVILICNQVVLAAGRTFYLTTVF